MTEVIIAQLCNYIKKHIIVHFKQVNYMVLYFSKVNYISMTLLFKKPEGIYQNIIGEKYK